MDYGRIQRASGTIHNAKAIRSDARIFKRSNEFFVIFVSLFFHSFQKEEKKRLKISKMCVIKS